MIEIKFPLLNGELPEQQKQKMEEIIHRRTMNMILYGVGFINYEYNDKNNSVIISNV